MEDLNLKKTIYNKKQINKTFTEFGNTIPPNEISQEEQIENFFILYKNLFYEIPKEGELNSHQYLINESSQYINAEIINEEINALLEEITELRQENLNLNQIIIESNISKSNATNTNHRKN